MTAHADEEAHPRADGHARILLDEITAAHADADEATRQLADEILADSNTQGDQ